MLEEKNKLDLVEKEEELDNAIDNSIANLPLDKQQEQIVQSIILAPTQKELQEQFNLFNITQSKKNALRIIKLNNLLDKVEDQAIERFESRPNQVSNKELLEYMQVVSNQIDRSQKYIDSLKATNMINVKNQKNEVNINIGSELSSDSKEKVLDAINSLLKQLEQNETKKENIIEAETVDLEKAEENSEPLDLTSKNILNTEDDSDSN